MTKGAMIFAAGLGKRMLPLTNKLPKPLIKVRRKSMLKNNIEKLLDAEFKNIVINAFYYPQKIMDEVKSYTPIVKVIVEEERLETGGGLLNAINNGSFDLSSPIILLNGDIFWIDQDYKSIEMIQKLWNPSKMDLLLCLKEKKKYFGYHGSGDFDIHDSKKKTSELIIKKGGPYVFTGLQIINPKILKKKKKIFSIRDQFLESSNHKKLFGFIDKNPWFHIGTVEDLKKFNKEIG